MYNRVYKFSSVIFLIIIMFMFGLIVGYLTGYASAVKMIVVEGALFLEDHGVNLDATAIQIGDIVNHYISILKDVKSGSGATYANTILNDLET